MTLSNAHAPRRRSPCQKTTLADQRHACWAGSDNPKDQSAWNDFVARYQPHLLKWCRGWRLKDADAQDVTQAVLLKLSSLMANFAYDPSRSFRGWLKTLAHHAWRDLVAERKRAGIGSGDSRMAEFFASLEAGDDLVRHIEAEFERELMEQAMELVRPRVCPAHLGRVPADRRSRAARCRGRRPARDPPRPCLRAPGARSRNCFRNRSGSSKGSNDARSVVSPGGAKAVVTLALNAGATQ